MSGSSGSRERNTGGLIRSMLVMGSAQAATIGISIIRQKLLAIILGPSGIGLLSIFQNLQSMATQAAGLGMASSGVRDIAAARHDPDNLSRVRGVLLSAHIVQGALASICIWLFRGQIAAILFGDTQRSTEVGLVGIAVLLALVAAAHTALLKGLRRIGDLARATVVGALVGTVAGLAAVWTSGSQGLIWFVLLQPLGNLVLAYWYVQKVPRESAKPLMLRQVPAVWLPMVRLGMAFMLGGLATAATLLFVRGEITKTLGLDAAGQFAAAWGITMTYVGFLLNSMAADYYPRLAEVIADRAAAIRLMNDQSQLALAIGGPVLILLIGWAPWVISLLYTEDFGQAISLLQWQSVGNIFKLASWPLGFSLAAAARGKTFLLMQLNFNLLFIIFILIGLPMIGLRAAGPAFMIAYVLHFSVVRTVVSYVNGFQPVALTRQLFCVHALMCFCVLALSLNFPLGGLILAPLLSLSTGVAGLRIVLAKVGDQGRLANRLNQLFSSIGWPVK